ncbi:hypothetical protein [Photorhabdus laumondii]|uniref:hypothetical protein n=1 Tax=Photorhabdus laumondii TaxID=2218628 RepID=UPI0033150A34
MTGVSERSQQRGNLKDDGYSIIYFIIISILQLIPFLGIFAGILGSVLAGGIIALCEKQRTTGEF